MNFDPSLLLFNFTLKVSFEEVMEIIIIVLEEMEA